MFVQIGDESSSSSNKPSSDVNRRPLLLPSENRVEGFAHIPRETVQQSTFVTRSFPSIDVLFVCCVCEVDINDELERSLIPIKELVIWRTTKPVQSFWSSTMNKIGRISLMFWE